MMMMMMMIMMMMMMLMMMMIILINIIVKSQVRSVRRFRVKVVRGQSRERQLLHVCHQVNMYLTR